MLSSTFRRAALAATARPQQQLFRRAFATGPASGGEISDDMLQKLGSLSTQALVDGLWVMGWPSAQIDGARPLAKGMKCVGRAVTLNFVPARPDIAQDKPAGGNSPEYEAFELCGPNEVRDERLRESVRDSCRSPSLIFPIRYWSCLVLVLGKAWVVTSSSFDSNNEKLVDW